MWRALPAREHHSFHVFDCWPLRRQTYTRQQDLAVDLAGGCQCSGKMANDICSVVIQHVQNMLTRIDILQHELNVWTGLVVWSVVAKGPDEELPFTATKSILKAANNAGGDLPHLHKALGAHVLAVSAGFKQNGHSNDLLDRIEYE